MARKKAILVQGAPPTIPMKAKIELLAEDFPNETQNIMARKINEIINRLNG